MDQPKVAGKVPCVCDIEQGTYYWCSCGESKNQPYCDGSHSGTAFSPVEFTVDDKKRVALCNCKHTGNPPFCDGAHVKLK